MSNIALAPWGSGIFDDYQVVIRQFYQHPLIEMVMVMIPLLVHALAGITLYVIRRKRIDVRRPIIKRLHSGAGLFLLLVIVGHILATRGASVFYGVYTEFEGLAFSLWFLPAFFYPYYFLLGLAGFYHLFVGLQSLLARFGRPWSSRHQWVVTVIDGTWSALHTACWVLFRMRRK